MKRIGAKGHNPYVDDQPGMVGNVAGFQDYFCSLSGWLIVSFQETAFYPTMLFLCSSRA
jgi:hypothetical protein